MSSHPSAGEGGGKGLYLKPCPFGCKGETVSTHHGTRYHKEEEIWWVECEACGMQGPVSDMSDAHAKELYNRRPVGSLDALREAAQAIRQIAHVEKWLRKHDFRANRTNMAAAKMAEKLQTVLSLLERSSVSAPREPSKLEIVPRCGHCGEWCAYCKAGKEGECQEQQEKLRGAAGQGEA
jgi:hypothetical protein